MKKELNEEKYTYSDWEQDVIKALEDIAQVITSDAQGIIDCQEFMLGKCWGLELSALETASIINTASLKI